MRQNVEIVKLLLLQGAVGERALELAMEYNHTEVVTYLLDNGIGGSDAKILEDAATAGRLDLVRRLLDRCGSASSTLTSGAHANLSAADISGRQVFLPSEISSVFRKAISSGELEVARELLGYYNSTTANIWSYDCTWDAPPGPCGVVDALRFLPIATGYSSWLVTIARFLVEAGADTSIDFEMPGGYFTLLQYAIHSLRIELAQYLIRNGIPVNSPPGKSIIANTALQGAAGTNCVELVNDLLRAGADVNAAPNGVCGATALQVALAAGDLEIARVLLRAGAEVNAAESRSGKISVLELAIRNGSPGFVRDLLDAGADPNTGHPQTPLQCAVYCGNLAIVRLLLSVGADAAANGGPKSRAAALQLAANENNAEIVRVLLDAGADVNAAPIKIRDIVGTATALQSAALNGNFSIASMLLDAGADVNAPPHKPMGFTALEAAAVNGRLDMVRYLLNAGADIAGPKSLQYRNAVGLAWMKGQRAMSEYIQDYKAKRCGDGNCEQLDEILKSLSEETGLYYPLREE